MNGTIAVEPDPAFPGGHGWLRVRGAAGKFGGTADFSIKRDDYAEGVFGPHGWQVADTLLTPDRQSVEGNDLLLHIGPPVVQRLDSGVYRIAIPALGIEANALWPDLPLLADEALNMVAEPAPAVPRAASVPNPKILRPGPDAPAKREQPGVTPPRPHEPPVVTRREPDDAVRIKDQLSAPDQPATRVGPRNWLPAAGLLLAVLAVAAGGGGYFGYHRLFPPGPEVQQQTPPHASTPLSQTSVAEALHSGASPEALVQEAQRRMQLGGPQRSEALLLLQGAADRNYAPAHAALGRFYDPNIQHPPEIQPDARQAASHYRLAVNGGDTSVTDARAALQAYLQQQASRGNDIYAPLILKEFWP